MEQTVDYKNLILAVQNYCTNIGRVETKIPLFGFFTAIQESEFQHIIYEPSLCIALQGEKAVGFDGQMYSYNSSKYLLTCTNVPADIKIEKCSKDNPYIALVLRFTVEEIYEVIKETKDRTTKNSKTIQTPLCFNKLDETLIEPIYKLVKLLDKPQEMIDFIAPLIKKEIIYVLLQENEKFLKNYIMEGTLANKIVKAVSEIKKNFNESINMPILAKNIGMSEASLYQNFKKVTSMSPLQYQKKIRLEEARIMLIAKNLQAHEVAFAVGYESASQFSREYSRMFGMSPKAHGDFIRNQDIA